MSRAQITYLLVFLFVNSITTPNIISYAEVSFEITELLDKGEEENKGKEPIVDHEFKILSLNNTYSHFNTKGTTSNLTIHLGNYTNNFVRIGSPPPEFIF